MIFRLALAAALLALPLHDAHASLDLTIGDRGLSLGNSPRLTGLRVNFRDSDVREINGVNITLWKARDNSHAVYNGISLGLIAPEGRHLNGVSIGLGGVAADGDIKGIAIGGLGAGAGGDVTGITFGTFGAGVGGDMTGLLIGGLGSGIGGDLTGVSFGLFGTGTGGNARGFVLSGIGSGIDGKTRQDLTEDHVLSERLRAGRDLGLRRCAPERGDEGHRDHCQPTRCEVHASASSRPICCALTNSRTNSSAGSSTSD